MTDNSRKALVLLTLAALSTTPVWAANETHVYGIANFNSPGLCPSGGSHSVHTSTAAAFKSWFDLLKLLGMWDETQTSNNTKARGRYFTDASFAASCSCLADDQNGTRGADAADVIYVHTHGGRTVPSPGKPGFSSISMGIKAGSGSSVDACEPSTNAHMKWGEDLDVAVIKACQSGDYEVWKNGDYHRMVPLDGKLRMWNAFHGDSSCGDHVTAYVSWYAMSSTYDGVGENWLDAAYDPWRSKDDCPVSIVFGESRAKRSKLFWNGGWKDRKDTGKRTGSTYYYFEGCAPSSGIKLPS